MIHGFVQKVWATIGCAALLYGALLLIASARAQTPTQGATPAGVDLPHIALLLPVDSSTFQRHGEALRDGFLAASKVPDPPTLLIRIYPVGEDPKTAVAAYQQAAQTGARVVVGPLLRAAATAVANGDLSRGGIQKAMSELMKGRTTFIIAQRISTITHADQIVVLDHGAIVQRGTHESLLASPGYYRDTYDMQLRDRDESSEPVVHFSGAVSLGAQDDR